MPQFQIEGDLPPCNSTPFRESIWGGAHQGRQPMPCYAKCAEACKKRHDACEAMGHNGSTRWNQ